MWVCIFQAGISIEQEQQQEQEEPVEKPMPKRQKRVPFSSFQAPCPKDVCFLKLLKNVFRQMLVQPLWDL